MSGVLLASKGSHPNPAATPSAVTEVTTPQAATFHEQVSSLLKSDVGELGFLFGHDPGQQAVSVAIPSPSQPAVTPAQSAAMASGMTVAAGPTSAANPVDPEFNNGTSVPVNAPPSAVNTGQSNWRFRDTLASEVGKIRGRVAKYQAAYVNPGGPNQPVG